MKTYCYDIETYKELTLFCFLNFYSDEVIVFEISKNKNQLQDLVSFLSQELRIITFNGIHFDSLITNYICQNYKKLQKLSNLEFCKQIHQLSQIVINQENDYDSYKPYSKYKYHKLYQEIDLFLLVSKGLRISKKLSLKFYAYNLDMNVQEMPVQHDQENLTDADIMLVNQYVINDVEVTKALAEKKKEEINLRFWIKKEYGLECLSWDAPKIASELFLKAYCDETFYKVENYMVYEDYKKEIQNRRYSQPTMIRLGDFIPTFNFKTKQFQDLYQEISNSYNTFSKELVVKNVDGSRFKITYGIGGQHTVQSNEMYENNPNYSYVDLDYASLYPSLYLIYNYNSPFFGYDLLNIQKDLKSQRIVAKKSKDKVKNEFLKLVLNSYSGLLGNQYSPFFAPEQVLGLRITGQLILTRLIEELVLNGISVFSSNTDGTSFKLYPNQEEILDKIIEENQKEFGIELERTNYKFIHYKTVNDYIALTDDNKIKVKGEFIYQKQLEGSNEFLIIPIALKEYFVNNVPIETTIRNHNNIYDFCFSKKLDKKTYEVYYNNQKVQQLNRVAVSKKGYYLYKKNKKKNTGIMENVLKDTPVIILNEPTTKTPQELSIDFNWYIKKAKEFLIELNNNNQTNLF